MDLQERWEQTTVKLDELPPRWAGLAGFCVFLAAGLVVVRLPSWGFVGGLLGLLLLLVWLALSGKPVVKLVFAPEANTAAGATASPPEPVPSPPVPRRPSELLEMVELPGGAFWMGSPESEAGRDETEARHRVQVSGFAMGKYPVTQGQYTEVMDQNPSHFQEPAEDGESRAGRPVEQVSWFDAVRFCNRLSEREGCTLCYRIQEPAEGTGAEPLVEWDQAADGYRLPTEAEWEYACRAGTETAYSFGDDAAQLGDYAWFAENSAGRTHAVGEKKPNGWGLHDLHGNVWEWCWDWYQSYKVTSDKDTLVTLTHPIGPPSGSWRVLRGGSFGREPGSLRAANRGSYVPEVRDGDLGFRCVRGSVRQP
ncbi:MAG TPA: formylglycine-generating enzyme family protein [Pseudomonadota bacterium]|nr:formylglycine-generating enzyme family protein [Pseudomonadota bacterium]